MSTLILKALLEANLYSLTWQQDGLCDRFLVFWNVESDRVSIRLEFICSLPCHRQRSNPKRIYPRNIELYELYREQFKRGY